MANINSVTISGNITHDPEVKQTGNGTTILNFSIACPSYTRGGDGEWNERPMFIDVSAFGRLAEGLKDKLTKGEHITVLGRLGYSTWDEKIGKRDETGSFTENTRKRVAHSIIATAVDYRAKKNVGENSTEGSSEYASENVPELYSEDIPF